MRTQVVSVSAAAGAELRVLADSGDGRVSAYYKQFSRLDPWCVLDGKHLHCSPLCEYRMGVVRQFVPVGCHPPHRDSFGTLVWLAVRAVCMRICQARCSAGTWSQPCTVTSPLQYVVDDLIVAYCQLHVGHDSHYTSIR